MTDRAFGEAKDYYRLRVIRVDETDTPEFEWRDDVLWRTPPQQDVEEYDVYSVQAVTVDDETAHQLRAFGDPDEAHAWLELVATDLAEMTKPEFDAAYLSLDDESARA